MQKKITAKDIKAAAALFSIPAANVYAILKVESRGDGFLDDGLPKILFERHIFYRLLGKMGMKTVRKQMSELRPDLCHRYPTQKGGYGKVDEQHQRLDDAVKLVLEVLPDIDQSLFLDFRDAALQSCSWGLGQLMGFNYAACGFDNIQQFINAMYKDEASQFEAMLQFLVDKNLLSAMRKGQWRKIARAYNGAAYAKHNYHGRLQSAAQSFED